MPRAKTQSSPGNLPAPLSAFIGRVREIAELRQMLRAHRLVTVTGPGGSGKTRLAVQAAREMQGEYEDGVWLVDLASLSEEALVTQTIASHLNIREQSGRLLIDSLVDHLSAQQALLVIDNCEHLIHGCAQVAATILQRCPNLRVLATSHEMLGVAGEAVFATPPLTLPEEQPWKSPASAKQAVHVYQRSEAVQLFVNRATSSVRDFSLNAENGAWISEICRRLDGMPLAIELAAARVKTLSVQQIANKLNDRFHLLVGGTRTAEPRQQTLAATLEWSYALLSEIEQKLLQRLSTFSGGFSLEAAEAICGDEEIKSSQVLELLSRLVDKSLVVVDHLEGGEARYRLLETIRQYAHDKLETAGELAKIRDRHLEYFLQLAELAEPTLSKSEEASWLDRLEVEHDNFRTALEWSRLSEVRYESGLRLTGTLSYFWEYRGYFKEGREHLAAILAKTRNNRKEPYAKALYRAAELAFLQTDYHEALGLLNAALSAYRELGPAGRLGLTHTLIMIGDVWRSLGDHDKSLSFLEEGLQFMRELKDSEGLVRALWQIGYSYVSGGEYEQAERYFSEALQLSREIGVDLRTATLLSGMAEAALRRGNLKRAEALEEESLMLRRNAGEKWGIAVSLANFAWISLKQNDFERAGSLLMESLALRREIGDRGGAAWCLEKLAKLSILIGQKKSKEHRLEDFHRAVRLFGAAAAIRSPLGSVIDQVDSDEYNRDLEMLKATLDAEEFARAWKEGSDQPFDDLYEELATTTSPGSSQKKKDTFGGLTEREREAASLISQGKSNREIAAAMTVSEKTVETYVTRILNKLGFESRVQIATWMMEKVHRKEDLS